MDGVWCFELVSLVESLTVQSAKILKRRNSEKLQKQLLAENSEKLNAEN